MTYEQERVRIRTVLLFKFYTGYFSYRSSKTLISTEAQIKLVIVLSNGSSYKILILQHSEYEANTECPAERGTRQFHLHQPSVLYNITYHILWKGPG
jgi:hypothetical protein